MSLMTNSAPDQQHSPMHIKAPPIKIQGIKTKLVPFILAHTAWDGNGRWIEPFLGSGAVLFNVLPRRAIVADTNEHIVNFYRKIQDGSITPSGVRTFLTREGLALSRSDGQYYYEVRERFNQHMSPLDFLFLNRACFNGLMRFNSRGGFNVPFCKKPDRFAPAYITKICNQVAWAARAMKGKDWQFHVREWRETLLLVREGDFVYLDPPYNDRHTDYYNPWSTSDAEALASAVKSLDVGFAYSTWKQNKYRVNEHLVRHFSDYPVVTAEHFYHVGSTEKLRNSMEEALVIAPGFMADHRNRSTFETLRPKDELMLAL